MISTNRRGALGLITTLFIVLVVSSFTSPARAAGSITVNVDGTYYVGGTTQVLYIRAKAYDGGSPYPGASIAEYTIYYTNHTVFKSAVSLTDAGEGNYEKDVDVKTYPSGNYTVAIFIQKDASNFDQKNFTLTVNHIFYFTGGPIATWEKDTDMVFIQSVPFFTSQEINEVGPEDNIVPATGVVTGNYKIYREGGILVAEGTLIYKEDSKKWVSPGIPMAWKGSGNFYAIASFTLSNGTEVTSPQSTPFIRVNEMENIITIVGIAGGIGGAFLLAVAIYMKRRGSKDIGRKVKEKKEKKEIKVLEISKEEIKKAMTGKVPAPPSEKPKEEPKGVTKKSEDLIFEVPKWEEED